jgi:hypothetical protein
MRYREFKLVESKILNEEGPRIDHAEDIVFWEGSKGAVRALESLFNLEKGGHEQVTIKWDGSPAIIFGRDENGEFLLTDKSGFTAKGYNGKAKSADDLEAMLMNRKGASNPDEAKRANYLEFVGNMKDIFDEYEKAVPKDLIGFFKGDLLYYNTPPLQQGNYVFTPNIVTYEVAQDSDLGQQIGRSKTGVVIHRYMDPVSGTETAVDPSVVGQFQGTEVLVVPPVTAQQPAQIDDENINSLKAVVAQNAQAIDALLDKNSLTELKMSDFSKILYTYVNQNGTNTNLGGNFEQWVAASNLSDAKKKRIVEWTRQNAQGFDALWQVVRGIQEVKNNIINQFDSHDVPVKSYINGQPGGEGYVLDHPQGSIKLVNRGEGGFTQANRAVQR